uniref:Nuclease associated modular domain-containing protein n=1 Tax=Entomoneis paludosa TaxID=265537 RepID=A0A7S3DP81_9STRA|mmetsp:Transcript_2542/g.5199  ORF Transcript_2542/g.5199 Transcript_2542/m.5199 type:complete len:488 (+) Transcript_2542:75-1538(+)|eukprot:CAMPEP_0172452778 /NCGR_PEP_ID=MMETSP1065-20121228/10342_1 /TAXON_ID=265537 /ORGANISM="Amphiprora paludosa, Strain CCMP125" /LENGTH=487 /DNA_ID=CAMNT_0013204891 /DNA_START=54 /DNA_END=1517 /DNA_ORIENTATION=+
MSDQEDLELDPEGAPSSLSSKRKRPLHYFDESEDTDEEKRKRPSYARRTERGGYAHTDKSREKIGQANKGNVPWNKGRNRSEKDRERIGAGVRERNLKVLKANLDQIGMTHEEYLKCRTDIKYVRERVRKARIADKDRVEKERVALEKLQNYWKNGLPKKEEEEPKPIIVEEIVEETESEDELEEEQSASHAVSSNQGAKHINLPTSVRTNPTMNTFIQNPPISARADPSIPAVSTDIPFATGVTRESTSLEAGTGESGATSSQQSLDANGGENIIKWSSEHMPSVFRRDINWNPHFYDGSYNNGDGGKGDDFLLEGNSQQQKFPQTPSFRDLCPAGGPGGLICCAFCTAKYSEFMMETQQNLEKQSLEQIGWETSTLVHFLKQTKERLRKSIPAARRAPPPVIPIKKKPPPPSQLSTRTTNKLNDNHEDYAQNDEQISNAIEQQDQGESQDEEADEEIVSDGEQDAAFQRLKELIQQEEMTEIEEV